MWTWQSSSRPCPSSLLKALAEGPAALTPRAPGGPSDEALRVMSVSAQSVLSRWAAFDEVLAALSKGVPCLRADGLWGSSRALTIAGLLQRTGRPILVLAPGPVQRHQAAQDTAFFLATLSGVPVDGPLGEGRVLEFPSRSGASWRGGRHREPDAGRAPRSRRPPRGAPRARGASRSRPGT